MNILVALLNIIAFFTYIPMSGAIVSVAADEWQAWTTATGVKPTRSQEFLELGRILIMCLTSIPLYPFWIKRMKENTQAWIEWAKTQGEPK